MTRDRDAAAHLTCAACMFVLFCLLVYLAGCSLHVQRGETRTLGHYDAHATVHPGGTLIVPADPHADARDLDTMAVWQCPQCGDWWPNEFPRCEVCR